MQQIQNNAVGLKGWKRLLACFMAVVLCVSLTPSPAAAAEASGSLGVANVQINAKSIAKAKIKLSKSSYTYDGKAKKPSVTVKIGGKKLAKSDYTVTYENNIKAGTAKVTVTGKGKYKDSVTKKFKITKRSIAKAKVKLAKSSYPLLGKAVTTTATVKVGGKKLKEGTDYTIAYKNNKKVGTATAVIKGKGNYNGSVKKTFKIVDPLIGKWKARAMSAAESYGLLIAVPSSSPITLNATSAKRFTIKLNGTNYSGRWKVDKTKDGIRYYHFFFNTREHWYGGIDASRELAMADVTNPDYSLIFNK